MSVTRLRPATAEDHDLYRRFFAELGVPEGPFERERWISECAATSVFLEEAGRDIAYAFWDASGATVHVRHVVVDPATRGRGLGRRLLLDLAALLRARGARDWRLNVIATNTAAIRLYRGLGFEHALAMHVLRLKWTDVSRLSPGRARVRDADARADAASEARFDLVAGELALARRRAGAHVVEARLDDGALAGLAAFDPHFPGARPFRVSASEHARPLIEALRERYSGPSDFVQLVLEGDLATARVLEGAGAQLVLELSHMRGEIPR